VSDPGTILLAIVAGGSAFAGIIATAARWQRKAEDTANASWLAAAAELEGRYVPLGGPWYNRTGRRIEASVDGVDVTVDHFEEGAGETSQTYTRAVAAAPSAEGFRLTVHDAGIVSALGTAVGAQDVEYDDPPFDKARVVRTSDEDLARHWINRRLRVALLRAGARVWKIEHGVLTVRQTGMVTRSDQLCELARTAGGLAARGAALGREWGTLGRSLGGRARGTKRWPDGARLELEDGVVVTLSRGRKRDSSNTLVQAPRAANARDTWTVTGRHLRRKQQPVGEELELGQALPDHSVWSAEPQRAAGRFDAATTARIRELAPKEMEASAQTLTIALPGLVLDRATLQSAIELARDLRAGLGSAYR
jgi:hypothetical protein